MIVLLGASGSGKSSIQNELVKRGYERILVDTTRPRRILEFAGIDYNFVPRFRFAFKKLMGAYICSSEYKLADGQVVKYGLPKPTDLKQIDGVVVINPKWLKDFVKYANKVKLPYMIVYITTSDDEIRERLLRRGDNLAEVQRRMKADKEDFAEIKNDLMNYSFFQNNKGSLKYVVSKIIDEYEGRNHEK